jgi:hypothetical protein
MIFDGHGAPSYRAIFFGRGTFTSGHSVSVVLKHASLRWLGERVVVPNLSMRLDLSRAPRFLSIAR